MNKRKDIKEKIHLSFAMTEKRAMIFYEVLILGRLSALKSDSPARAKILSLQITTLKQLVWYYTMPPAMTCVGLEN